MKVLEVLSKAEMTPVPKARNLDSIGVADGYMVVKYRGRAQLYIYGPNIPAGERDKILRVPYPDRIFTQVIAKKFKCFKVSNA